MGGQLGPLAPALKLVLRGNILKILTLSFVPLSEYAYVKFMENKDFSISCILFNPEFKVLSLTQWH